MIRPLFAVAVLAATTAILCLLAPADSTGGARAGLSRNGVSIERRQVGDLEERAWRLARRMDLPSGAVASSWPDGREAFSETLGMRMAYLIDRDSPAEFRHQMALLETIFVSPVGLIAWKSTLLPGGQEWRQARANASVDDLRIAGALIRAGQVWPDMRENAMKMARGIARALERHQMLPAGVLADTCSFSRGLLFWSVLRGGATITLSYLDLESLSLIAHHSRDLGVSSRTWQRAMEQARSILEGSGRYHVMPTSYDTARSVYGFDGTTNMILSMISLIQAAKAGVDVSVPVEFLKEELHRGRVYGSYKVSAPRDVKRGEVARLTVSAPDEAYECPAVYAMILLLASTLGDLDMARTAYSHLERAAVELYPSEIAFLLNGGAPTVVNAFSQYSALLALRSYQNLLHRAETGG